MTLPRNFRHEGGLLAMEANEVQELKEHAEHASGESEIASGRLYDERAGRAGRGNDGIRTPHPHRSGA